MIIEQIIKFVRLKDFISIRKNEFSLLINNGKLYKEIEFSLHVDFISKVKDFQENFYPKNIKKDLLDMNDLFAQS